MMDIATGFDCLFPIMGTSSELLQTMYLRFRKVVVQRVAVNSRCGNGTAATIHSSVLANSVCGLKGSS